MTVQSAYQNALIFAATKHFGQTVPGTELPYIVHLSSVAMEVLLAAIYSTNFNIDLSVQMALLHDTLEDTTASYEELKNTFGEPVAQGVLALTKNKSLPKEEQMRDSLNRIKQLPTEVWAIKLADRITNLKAPPKEWEQNKKTHYMEESKMIFTELEKGNEYLAKRLNAMIQSYTIYTND